MLNQEQINQPNDQTTEGNRPLSRGQKAGAVALAFFSFLIVGWWWAQFQDAINRPFVYQGKDNQTVDQVQTAGNRDDQALRLKDTDNDGLSDYDELNIYQTSPYLADSDSDGFSDKEEIASGNNPNCPAGKDCAGFDTMESSESGVATNTVDSLLGKYNQGDQILTQNPAIPSLDQQDAAGFLSGDLTASELRTLLLDSGMDQAILGQISDQDLIKSFNELMSQ